MGEIVGPGVVENGIGNVAAGYSVRLAAEAFGQAKAFGNPITSLFAQLLHTRGLDMDRGPRRTQPISEAPCITHNTSAIRSLVNADQHALAGGPGPLDRVRPHVVDHLIVDAIRR